MKVHRIAMGALVASLLILVTVTMIRGKPLVTPNVFPHPGVDPGQPRATQVESPPNSNIAEVRKPVGSDTNSLRVIVRLRSGDPVESATIRIDFEGQSQVTGETDERGLLDLELSTTPCVLLVSARGCLPATVSIDHPAPPEVLVILEVAGCIRGRVTGIDAGNAEGVTVVAFPARLFPKVADLSGSAELHFASAAADGTFALCNVPRNERWTVLAGCPGFATPAPATEVIADSDPLTLQLEAYSHLALELKSADGTPPCITTNLLGLDTGFGCSILMTTDRKWLRYKPVQAALAGIPAEWCEASRFRRLMFMPSRSNAPGSLGIKCSVRIPGYHETFPSFAWRSLTDGFEVATIELQPFNNEWSQVRVFLSVPDSVMVEESFADEPLLELLLVSTQGGKAIRMGVPTWPKEGGALLDCIPAGAYECRLLFCSPFFQVPVSKVPSKFVDLQGLVDLSFNIEGVGSMEARLVTEAGVAYDGTATFRITMLSGSGSPGAMNYIGFFKPPYKLPYCPPGRYEVAVDSPRPVDGRGEATFDLASGQTEAMSFAIATPD